MRINKFVLPALVYFFLNSVGLPFGLTYTTLLSPFLYYWILVTRKREIMLPYLLACFPFIAAQLIEGVDMKIYLISFLGLTSVYIFCQAFYTFLVTCKDIDRIFRILLTVNFVLCLVAIPFYFSDYYSVFWIKQYLTKGVNNFLRLRLFTYEASYYSTLFVPLFFYYFFKVNLGINKKPAWLILLAILMPLIMSFSLGVLTSTLLALIIVSLLLFRYLSRKPSTWLLWGGTVGLVTFLLLVGFIFFPNNTLFFRLDNIFSGADTSGNGRTYQAFFLANEILQLKNVFFGVGPGQIKVFGTAIIRDFYAYPIDFKITSVPNTTAETLAIFGVAGMFIRFGAEFFLFYHTRVWTNYFRLALFLFIFIYQLTGSFMTNLGEYVVWILAFTRVFPQFDVAARQVPVTSTPPA